MRGRRRDRRERVPPPLLSPAIQARRARHRRQLRTRRLTALTALALVLVGGTVAVLAAGRSPRRGPARSGAPVRTTTEARPPPSIRRRRRVARPSAADRAWARQRSQIDAVLRYTPFLLRGRPRHKVIALTFDDGPGPYTESVLGVLRRMRAPATFFVVGQQLNDFAGALRDELRDGFVIGDHTENHAWLVRLPATGQLQQVHDAALRIHHIAGHFPLLFRPPYGAYNATTMRLLRRLGMLMVLWSVDPSDWRRPGTGAIIGNVLGNAQPGGVVLMHDGGGDRSQTVAALPAIISGLRARGYRLVTVPQLLALDPPPRGQRLPHVSGV